MFKYTISKLFLKIFFSLNLKVKDDQIKLSISFSFKNFFAKIGRDGKTKISISGISFLTKEINGPSNFKIKTL